jgi:hypothetical protein
MLGEQSQALKDSSDYPPSLDADIFPSEIFRGYRLLAKLVPFNEFRLNLLRSLNLAQHHPLYLVPVSLLPSPNQFQLRYAPLRYACIEVILNGDQFQSRFSPVRVPVNHDYRYCNQFRMPLTALRKSGSVIAFFVIAPADARIGTSFSS